MTTDATLRERLSAERPLHERMLALHRLGKEERKTPMRVELLREVLADDPDPVIRHDAAFVLGAMMAEEAEDALIDAALHDPSFLVRHESFESLAFFSPTPAVMAAVEAGLTDEHPDVRETAVMVRAYQLAKPVEVGVEPLLDANAPMHLRWAAAFSLLGEHHAGRAPDAVSALKQVLRSDSSGFVRHTAAFMLEEVGGVTARAQLTDAAFHDQSLLVRHEAIETLGFMPPHPDTRTVLETLKDDADPIVALTARIACDIFASREHLESR
jgi:HEAT repeat protein